MKTAQMQAALEAAIAKHENAEFPGIWEVNSGDEYVMLVWSCEELDLHEMRGDEPWSDWGGNAIIKDADIGDPDDSGCDGYCDGFDEMVSQWVQWNVAV